MNSLRLRLAILATTSLVTACGGGGDSNAPVITPLATPVTKVEGYYTGTVSNGTQFQLLALENDQVYSLVGNTDAQGTFRVASLVEGPGTSANGSFSVSNAKEYSANGQVFAGTISGSFNPRANVMGTVASNSSTLAFSGTVPVSTSYNYDTPASSASATGTWSGATLFGESVSFTVASTGTVSGLSAQGCRFTGTVGPRPSGKNVFDVTVTFGSAPCATPGATGAGIGVISPLTGGRNQLLLAFTDAGRTRGTVVFAQK